MTKKLKVTIGIIVGILLLMLILSLYHVSRIATDMAVEVSGMFTEIKKDLPTQAQKELTEFADKRRALFNRRQNEHQ